MPGIISDWNKSFSPQKYNYIYIKKKIYKINKFYHKKIDKNIQE